MSNHTAGDSADNIVPFGKHRGQPVEVMLADRAYTEWALAQPGIRERYPTFVTIVVDGGRAPDAPTPEHNRLQLVFRNPAMRVAAIGQPYLSAVDLADERARLRTRSLARRQKLPGAAQAIREACDGRH